MYRYHISCSYQAELISQTLPPFICLNTTPMNSTRVQDISFRANNERPMDSLERLVISHTISGGLSAPWANGGGNMPLVGTAAPGGLTAPGGRTSCGLQTQSKRRVTVRTRTWCVVWTAVPVSPWRLQSASLLTCFPPPWPRPLGLPMPRALLLQNSLSFTGTATNLKCTSEINQFESFCSLESWCSSSRGAGQAPDRRPRPKRCRHLVSMAAMSQRTRASNPDSYCIMYVYDVTRWRKFWRGQYCACHVYIYFFFSLVCIFIY